MHFKISNEELLEMYNIEEIELPKYVPQLLNLANQNSQATRPRNVGQLSELFQEFVSSHRGASVKDWEDWYLERYPNAIDEAAKKISLQIENLKKAINQINEDYIKEWLRDLIVNKTFTGLGFQEVIIKIIALKKGESWRLAEPYEESQGIDGYIGKTPVSVKPETYKTMDRLSEHIDVAMIYYDKKKDGIVIAFEE